MKSPCGSSSWAGPNLLPCPAEADASGCLAAQCRAVACRSHWVNVIMRAGLGAEAGLGTHGLECSNS